MRMAHRRRISWLGRQYAFEDLLTRHKTSMSVCQLTLTSGVAS